MWAEIVGFGLGFGERDAGLEAGDDRDGVAPVANFLHVGGDEKIGVEAGRKDGGKIEGWRENTDDGDDLVIEVDGSAGDVGVACELLLPIRVGEKSDGSGAFLMLSGEKGAAEHGVDPESVKEIVGDHDGLHVLRIAVTGHVVFGAAPEGLVAGDFLEGLRVAREFLVGADVIGGARKPAFAVVAGEPDQLLGMRER